MLKVNTSVITVPQSTYLTRMIGTGLLLVVGLKVEQTQVSEGLITPSMCKFLYPSATGYLEITGTTVMDKGSGDIRIGQSGMQAREQ